MRHTATAIVALLLSPLALATEPEGQAPSLPAEPSQEATEELPTEPPTVPAKEEPAEAAAPLVDEMVITTEPLQYGDDRTGSELERQLRDRADQLRACRERHAGPDDTSVYRFLQYHVTVRPKGELKKLRIQSSTRSQAVDRCVTDLLGNLRLEKDTPRYDDRFEVNITWKKPEEPGDAEAP